MAGPAVDVLLPVRAARRTLPSAVGDLLAQQRVEVRVVAVVDAVEGSFAPVAGADGSGGRDDGSRAWLRAAAADEPRLVVMDGPGRGPGPALDEALMAARSPLVALMEADDRCPPDRLRRLYDHMERHPHLMGVVSRVGQIGARTPGMRRYLDWQNSLLTSTAMAAERFVEIPAMFQTGLYRRHALWAAGGFAPRGDWPIDIAFWFRWHQVDLPVEKVPRVLYHWRQHARQSTRSGALHDAATLRACKVAHLEELHGRLGFWPRPLHLLSTGATLDSWRAALESTDVALVCADEWKPGATPPAWPRPAPTELPPPGSAARWGPPLLLVAYGMASTRHALREALGNPGEPQELMFCA